ncbi:bifunctional folylpolyglutamate synthase/dihydrofolate synthase [Ornithinimicrobium sp. Arc0846-15]|nr:bifunctional folylpolyglutamate synthase/dihydrofolate synthase [Ornithinimicrobium laminariae]
MSGTAEDLKLRMALVTEEILARTPENNPEPTLDRVAEVMDLMGSPQQTFGVIHLTGTNGKTSTARMVETMLAEMGLNTGRFTSPHLHDLRERIAIGGESITHERFLAAYDDVLPFVRIVDEKSVADGGPKLTYFEILVCVAYAAFADTPVDVAVIEVGLGGVWDATNVADGLVSVLTPISIDHTRLLGNTVESIATEKVGIIKPDSVVVTGVQTHEVMEIIAAETEEKDASLQAEGVAFGVLEREVAVGGQVLSVRGLAGDYTDLFMPLYGAHQAHNAAIAVAAVEAFVGGGEQRLTDEVIRSAFANFSSPGRLEIVRRSPTVLVDAAHNPAGVEALVEAVRESFMFGRLVGVIGVLAEKDAESMIALLEPVLDHIVLTRTTSPRAVSPQRLGEIALGYFGEDRISVIRDLPDALDLAAGMADDGGMSGAVLATGSVVTAAEVRMLLGRSAT